MATGTAKAKQKTTAEMGYLRWFDDVGSTEQGLVGGKAINLGVMALAGYPVPNGFTVTTTAYVDAMREAGLDEIIAKIDYNDADALEASTSKIRDLILQTPVPDGLAAEITAAYDKLGPNGAVAVRSSATAEDVAGASFAGLYESYLNIVGHAELLKAVRECWASLWSSRASSYRHQKELDIDEVSMAVIVQTMANPEVSGVMFTANPLTTVTDEIVINASWGLGEAIVQGIVTPDLYIVKLGTLDVIEREIGTKTLQIVRDPDSPGGTVTVDTPTEDQERLTLSDEQVAKLAALGQRVMADYGQVPQDLEWAFSEGEFFLLQTRAVTGVEFSWDEDLETWQWAPEADDDTLWSRAWSDSVWTGAITPMMYSFRGRAITDNIHTIGRALGIDELANLRMWKFFRGMAYANPMLDKLILTNTWLPGLRENNPLAVALLPSTWHQDVIDAPFNYIDYLKMHARLMLVKPESGVRRWFKTIHEYIDSDEWDLANLPDLQQLSDENLRRLMDKYFDYELAYGGAMAIPFMIWIRDALKLLELIVTNWYDGPNNNAFAELVSGCKARTKTLEENLSLYQLSEQIRSSDTLSELFQAHEGEAFFEAAAATDDGAQFLEDHRAFVHLHGHRGMEDRDIWYPRRYEEPYSIDYRNLKYLLNSEPFDPEAKQDEVNDRREAAYDEVVENIKRGPLGSLKVEAFKVVYDYIHKFNVVRDDERWSYERYMYAIKLMCLEMGRRLTERGALDEPGDSLFVGKDELYALSKGQADIAHTARKIAGRKRDFERILHRETNYQPPMYLQRNRPITIDVGDDDGSLRGIATSGGRATGIARVVGRIDDIGRVNPGEILVCNATDPGWTPVFMLIHGIVTETGGMLAHASCLSREYGLASVQIPNAMQLIPDGATITVDGYTGEVEIHDDVELDSDVADETHAS
jgi:phosphoenolpyruvate synthase/pyruvate phosphate dikinase